MHLWQSGRDPGPPIPENNLAATSKRTLQPVCASLVGSDVVEHLHGAFSVAVWDEKEQRFLLAIDRLGIKSLYWSQENGALLFGSRLASIRVTRNESFELDPHAISQYLLFAVIPHPLT